MGAMRLTVLCSMRNDGSRVNGPAVATTECGIALLVLVYGKTSTSGDFSFVRCLLGSSCNDLRSSSLVSPYGARQEVCSIGCGGCGAIQGDAYEIESRDVDNVGEVFGQVGSAGDRQGDQGRGGGRVHHR